MQNNAYIWHVLNKDENFYACDSFSVFFFLVIPPFSLSSVYYDDRDHIFSTIFKFSLTS